MPISPMHKQVGAAGNRLHAEGHGGGAIALRQRRLLGDIACGIFERQIEHLEAEIIGHADLVDGRAAGREILDHLLRHRWRKRRDVLFDDTMVSGKDRHQRPVDGRRPARPGGKPEGDFLEPSQSAGRLCQLRIALARSHQRPRVRTGQIAQKGAEIVERQA
jgi:hypothetical protein